VKDVKSAWSFVKNGVGHVVADVIPYKLMGNVRTDSRLGRLGDSRTFRAGTDTARIQARYVRLQEYLANKQRAPAQPAQDLQQQ
jgi:hypothetical protein